VDIPVSSRSKFFDPISRALDESGGCPALGSPVRVSLSQEGYEGEIIVIITPDHEDTFASDWEGSDVSRFPARIRAAATVLRMRQCFGKFIIQHEHGNLVIARLST
jgi:hypothetical protein